MFGGTPTSLSRTAFRLYQTTLMFEAPMALACRRNHGLPPEDYRPTVPRKSCFVRIEHSSNKKIEASIIFEMRYWRACAQLEIRWMFKKDSRRQKVPLETLCYCSCRLTTVKCCRPLIIIPGMVNTAVESVLRFRASVHAI